MRLKQYIDQFFSGSINDFSENGRLKDFVCAAGSIFNLLELFFLFMPRDNLSVLVEHFFS